MIDNFSFKIQQSDQQLNNAQMTIQKVLSDLAKSLILMTGSLQSR